MRRDMLQLQRLVGRGKEEVGRVKVWCTVPQEQDRDRAFNLGSVMVLFLEWVGKGWVRESWIAGRWRGGKGS